MSSFLPERWLHPFKVDELYSSSQIQKSLHVGNAGGVRHCLDDEGNVLRVVIMTSVPSARQANENPYHDRMEGDILVYTGAGREGDQTLAGVNKRIPQQLNEFFPIYGFQLVGSRRNQSIGPKRWKFLGLLEYLRHYPEHQIDVRGLTRKVWLFEMRVHKEPSTVPIENASSISAEMILRARDAHHLGVEDRTVVSSSLHVDSGVSTLGSTEVETIRANLLGMPPEKFEHLIKDVLANSGFDKVSVTKFSQDGGIDVNAYSGSTMWPIKNMLIQLQAKRWLHTVGRKEVAELRGSLQPFSRGAVVTTSHFSKAAILEAEEPGKNPIVLIDGHEFASLVRSIKPRAEE